MSTDKATPASRIWFKGTFLSAQTKQEVRQLISLAWPTILNYFLHNLLFTISLLFAGRLGKAELAATVLAMSYIAITGTVVGSGVVTAVEALCAQAYHTRRYRLIGVVLQRGVCFLGIALLLVWAIWTNAEPLLLMVKQSKEIARLSQLFVFIWFPALIADSVFVLIQRYLQIQGIFKPMIIVGVTANVMLFGLNILLVQGFDIGFRGVALASCLTYSLFLGASALLYLLCSKLYHRTWPIEGWTVESLQHWGQFSMLAVSGVLMLCIEWCSFEVGTFIAGTFGEQHLAAHGILMQFASLVYLVPLGLSVAVCVRVRNTLGKGDHTKAKLILKVSIGFTCCFTAALSIILIVLRDHLGKTFTTCSEVVSLVSKVTPAMAGFAMFVSIQVICCGIIRGSGRPNLGLFINFVFHYCAALPMGITFAFYVFEVGLEGFWWGITAGLGLQTIAFIPILWWISWDKYAKMSLNRASQLSWSTGNERGDEDDLIVSWLFRTSSLFSIKTNFSLRDFTHPPDPIMSWIVRSSSLLSLHATPLRTMSVGNKPLFPEETSERESVSEKSGIDGSKMTLEEKRNLVACRLMWFMFALLVLLSAVIVRVVIPLPEGSPEGKTRSFTSGNKANQLKNLTST